MEVLLPRTKLFGWRDSVSKMASDNVKSPHSLLDLDFQSLAAQELNMKQMELDSATAKLDQLRWELEKGKPSNSPSKAEGAETFNRQNSNPNQSPSLTLWSVAPQSPSSLNLTPQIQGTQGSEAFIRQNSNPSLSPSLTRRSVVAPQSPSSLSLTPQLHSTRSRQESTLAAPMSLSMTMNSTSTVPSVSFSSSPNFTRRSLPADGGDTYMTVPSRPSWGRPTSPRLQYFERPASSSPARLSSGSYDYGFVPRSVSPAPDGPPMGMYTEWAPPHRPPPAYEAPLGFSAPRYSDNVGSLQRRPPQRSWNESDLDTVFDKKTHQERSDRVSLGGVPVMKAWRESSLDPAPVKGKGEVTVSSTLPRGYKFSSMDRGPQGPDPGWKTGSGTLPRSLPSQQPISRIPVPPPGGRGQPHRPLPLSMIFRLQNAFWEHQAPPQMYSSTQMNMPPAAPVSIPVVPEFPMPAATPVTPAPNEEVPRPLSPTRLQPQLPPSLAEVQRVLEDIPRPLRRRGSQEHTALTQPHSSDRRQYRQIMGRLFGRAAPKPSFVPEQTKTEEKLQGSGNKAALSLEEQVAEAEIISRMNPIPEEPKTEDKPQNSTIKSSISPEDPMCIILEASESRVGATAPVQLDLEFSVPVVVSRGQNPELRSALRGRNSPRRGQPRRARLDPLILLLDGALTGELDVVTQALREVKDPSQPNEEGITALHNAICGANFHIVNLLITSGANVNAADSHGWTPLHCAASCNDLQICHTLVRHGAAIFATTFSDGSLAVDKCDPYREGYKECLTYLTEVEQCMGETQSGVVYAVWDYTAEFADELSVREGDSVTVLRKDEEGGNWWWAALCGREGYVPRNYFGMYPRLRPQRSPL
ncbi:relA-associated inhibitor isoform X2 [Hyla sarda]|uniref:relA-associated inhibitor isoform X2 n=1 Tax=Hyla sarda TaxID=327740 RepID=UPI0024C20C79|nr:relA-associated inhibitor isoform X2 [Hyla sarda]